MSHIYKIQNGLETIITTKCVVAFIIEVIDKKKRLLLIHYVRGVGI